MRNARIRVDMHDWEFTDDREHIEWERIMLDDGTAEQWLIDKLNGLGYLSFDVEGNGSFHDYMTSIVVRRGRAGRFRLDKYTLEKQRVLAELKEAKMWELVREDRGMAEVASLGEETNMKTESRFSRIADRLVKAQNEAFELDEQTMEVAKFFKENPNPKDEVFHKWAEGKKYDVPSVEASAYKLATICTSFLLGGRANEKKLKAKDVDKDELAMGIKVEMEHTTDKRMAERITLDHLAEAPKDAPLKYYTGLKLLERMIESLVKIDKGDAEKKISELKRFVDDLEKAAD